MRHASGKHDRDSGFTLPELLISVVIIATIATVMVGVTAVVLRNTPTTQARAEDARSLMGLVTWLPQDVDSTPPTGFDLEAATDSGCNVNPGTNLLRLQWTERASSTTVTYIASYRSVPTASGIARIKRVTCSGVGAPPLGGYTNGASLNMTSDLPSLPTGWGKGMPPVAVTIDTATGSVPLVTFAVTTLDGDVVYTDSAPKNPAMTLPSTTAPSWKPPTPITAVEVNTVPTTNSLAFTVHAAVATNASLVVYDDDGDPLIVELEPASVPVGWNVTLSSLSLSVTAPNGTPFDVPYVISYTVDDDRGGVVTGTVTVTVVDPSAVSTTTSTSTTTTTTTTTTTLAPACVVTGRSIAPSSVKNVQPDSHNQGGGNVNVGVLKDPVVVSATTNEHCAGLQIQYDSGGVNSPPFRVLNQTGSTTWTVTLESRDMGSSETWSDGAHTIAFHSANGGSWGTATLTVT